MKIFAFGQIAEITGKSLEIDAADTDQLHQFLMASFKELTDRKFAIAVNKKIISKNVALHQTDEIALMPPYSGG